MPSPFFLSSGDESEVEREIMKNTDNRGVYEKHVPSSYDDGVEKDDYTGKTIPRRLLDNFQFKFVDSDDNAPLESISKTSLVGEGEVISGSKEAITVHFVATEWSIEYGLIVQLQDTPQLWVKSRNCWYKLQGASTGYKETFGPTLQRASLCTTLVDVLDSLHSSDSEGDHEPIDDYASVLSSLLSRNKQFTEKYLLSNHKFVIEQLSDVDLPTNGFIKTLKKKGATTSPVRSGKKRKSDASSESEDEKSKKRKKDLPKPAKNKGTKKKDESKAKSTQKQKEQQKKEKEKQREDERKKAEKDRLKQEARRYPMDDSLLEKKMRKDGQFVPSFPEPVTLPFPVPPHAIGGVLLVWEFGNTFRKVIGLARNSFTAEDLACGLSIVPTPEHLTLVIQVHVALLSFLLAQGRGDDDDEKHRKAPEHLRLAYEQLRKVPITHSTWFEVLRQFMVLLHEEDKDDVAESDVTEAKLAGVASPIADAVHALGVKEYEALLLEHKLALLETLCYEASNTPLFRQHMAEHVETVDALRKEKRVEELKLKEKRKIIESNVKKMVAEQREKDSVDLSATDASQKHVSHEKSSRRALPDEERSARQVVSEQRKLEEEQKRLENAKRVEDRSIKAAGAKFASAITKETRLIRTPCAGQDRNFRRYWIFAGGKGRGFCAGRLLVEHSNPYSAVVDGQSQEGSKSTRWSYYPDKEVMLEFISKLNQKGVRELALYKSLTSITNDLRVYGAETSTQTPTESTTLTKAAQIAYRPPSLKRLKDTITDFKDRIPEGMLNSTKLETQLAECKDTIPEFVTLLRDLELHLADTMFTEEWQEHKDKWRQDAPKAATTAQVAVLLSQLENAVKLIANAKGCTVCRGTSDEAHILLCDSCENEYHTYCLHPPLASIPRGEWVCPSCKERRPDENDDVCTECRGRGELLCCDYCSRAYHLKCVSPPLTSIPRGKWGCSHCVENLPAAKKSANKRSAHHAPTTRMSTRARKTTSYTEYFEL